MTGTTVDDRPVESARPRYRRGRFLVVVVLGIVVLAVLGLVQLYGAAAPDEEPADRTFAGSASVTQPDGTCVTVTGDGRITASVQPHLVRSPTWSGVAFENIRLAVRLTDGCGAEAEPVTAELIAFHERWLRDGKPVARPVDDSEDLEITRDSAWTGEGESEGRRSAYSWGRSGDGLAFEQAFRGDRLCLTREVTVTVRTGAKDDGTGGDAVGPPVTLPPVCLERP